MNGTAFFFNTILKMANIRKKARQQRRQQRQNAKTTRQAARQATRLRKAENRQSARVQRQQKRLDKRDAIQSGRQQKALARKSVRNAKQLEKIYGEMSPEDVNAVNAITPYVGAMADVLQENGVQVDDWGDPIEVAAKFEYNEPEIEQPFDYNDLNNAYYEDEDEDEYFLGGKGKDIMKGVLGGIQGALGSFVNTAKEKERSGVQLSQSEQRLLEANSALQEQLREAVKNKVSGDIGNTVMKYLPWAAAALLVYLLFFNKK